MDNKDLYAFEEWRDIQGMKCRYQASNLGRICRLKADGNRVMISDRYVNGSYMVSLRNADGVCVSYPRITLVGDAWLGKRDGYIYLTKNGVVTDLRVSNIKYATRSEALGRVNQLKRKPVIKFNRHGDVVKIYSSLTECANDTWINKSNLAKRCRGMYESILAEDGFAYCYEDNTDYLEELGLIFNWEGI